MIRKILIALVCMGLFTPAKADGIKKGYRAFVEWCNDLSGREYYSVGNSTGAFYTGFSITQGRQINGNWFLGIGFMYEPCLTYNKRNELAPFYLDLRREIRLGEKKLPFYTDLRVGYNIMRGGGFYASPTIGYRYHVYKRLGLNFGLGLTVKNYIVGTFADAPDPEYSYDKVFTGRERHFKAMLAFRVGIDF